MASKRYRPSPKGKKQRQTQKIPFTIEKMDGLGQGVSKIDNKVTFIAKTLPAEQGHAVVFKRSKGVSFAKLKQLDVSSSERIESLCPHFNDCPACHYLHTDYEQELIFKEQALKDLSRQLALPDTGIDIYPAPQRMHYRNRLQLHYRHQYLGMVDASSDQIVEIPECKIIRPELQDAFDALFNDKSWSHSYPGSGHVELYWRDKEGVSIQWNETYAFGGFSQVYEAMNELLCGQIYEFLREKNAQSVLDLFSGIGNLSNAYAAEQQINRNMVDFSPENQDADFTCLDLFNENALSQFQRLNKKASFDTFVVDPPRKGFPLLAQWVKRYKPKHLAYISCNAATLVRDLHTLSQEGITHEIQTMNLLDLFPGTYHYETVVYIRF